MPQEHLDRLSAVDAAFLHQEGASAHMHIGGVARFSGPPPAYGDALEHVRSRLHLVPRYRQKVVTPPAGLGRHRWVDDPCFNLEYHVRHTALPSPGGDDELHGLVARVFAQRLDRTKPLWELWIVEGLQDGGWALMSKTHHALVDGVSSLDLTTVLFDVEPEPRHVSPGAWEPRPEPTAAQLTADALGAIAQRAASLPIRAAAAVVRPGVALAGVRETAAGVGEVVRQGMTPAPPSPLNVPIGSHRRVTHVAARLDDFKDVKDVFGGTVNDVVLAVVAGALRSWYHAGGVRTDGVELKACVPVSTRVSADEGTLGNHITHVIAPLPIGVPDPVERLRRVSVAMTGVKDSTAALGAEVIAGMQDFAPPTILAQASRLNFSGRFYNVLVTNIPGPQLPLYALGQELLSMFPVAFLAGDRALAVAVMSYNGSIDFGLIGDYDQLDDLEVVADGLRTSLADLVSAAGGGVGGPGPDSRRNGRSTARRAAGSRRRGRTPAT
jgi:WS/DGAT/MGAT family acyltransferase